MVSITICGYILYVTKLDSADVLLTNLTMKEYSFPRI
ncbi:hypothetical protein SDC9_190271 [bioreactor metagenome]|uniref:Uncharacterized protein n=1 Tax=bioreactor metagenome TaxID=1076179 RepID=A0A645I2V5_9ZZZZ